MNSKKIGLNFDHFSTFRFDFGRFRTLDFLSQLQVSMQNLHGYRFDYKIKKSIMIFVFRRHQFSRMAKRYHAPGGAASRRAHT